MFFLVFAGDGILVSENEMDFICRTAFIGSKHDCVRSLVGEFLSLDSFRRFGEKFEIGTSTFKSILKFDFISAILAFALERRKYCMTRVLP